MTKMNSFFVDLNDRNSENAITEKLSELNSLDHREIKLEIKNSSKKEIQNLSLDIDLFRKIKEVQDLPDWVIVKLILAKGNLKDSDFKKRILND